MMPIPRFLISLLLTLSIFAGPLEALEQRSEPLRIDLARAVRLALEKNFEIRVDSYSPLLAAARIREARGVFDPEFRFDWEWGAGEPLEFGTGALGVERVIAAPESRSESITAGVGGLLAPGTTWDLSTEVLRQETQGPESFQTFAGLRVAQPLFRGFGSDVNLAPIRIARIAHAESVWQFRNTVMDVVTRTALIYHDLLFARENLEVELRSRSLAQRLLDDNTQRADIGVMSPLDVTGARAEVAAREEGVILARRSVRDNENFLKQLVTDEVQKILGRPVEPRTVPRLDPPVEDVVVAIGRALEWRPDYRQALLDLGRRSLNIVVARDGVLPRIDLTASFGVNGLDRSLADSIQRTIDQEGPEWTVGAVVRVPIGNRGPRARRDTAELERAQALVSLKRLEQDIVVTVDNALGQIETGRQRIEATRQARLLARERLDAEEEKLRAGTSTTFVVLELQKDLATAEAAELRALADYNKAVITFDREIGATLDRHQIVLDL